jgi:thioredoxin-related protein
MKKTILLLVAIIAGSSIMAKAQSAENTSAPSTSSSKNGIHWISIQEAEKLNKKHPKKIIIDTYTDWCGWCKRLDATTWSDARIIDYINKNYYAVKFNAETKDSIVFNGKVYHFNANMRANELAYTLLDGQLAYPTIIVMDESLAKLTVIPGYQAADPMNNIVHYFGDNIYKTVEWTAFSADPSKYIKN